jgi:parvulin-like peptidyl-prolyl isomerase
LPRELPLSPIGEVASVFGPNFAQQITQLPVDQWAGPIQSGYGWHLVYVSERSEGGSRPLADVRDAVEREWMEAYHKRTVEATYQKLREKYSVVIETQGPLAQGAPAGSRSVGDGLTP